MKKKQHWIEGYEPRYYISENGVGHMPSSEIAKTKSFWEQMEACRKLHLRSMGKEINGITDR